LNDGIRFLRMAFHQLRINECKRLITSVTVNPKWF